MKKLVVILTSIILTTVPTFAQVTLSPGITSNYFIEQETIGIGGTFDAAFYVSEKTALGTYVAYTTSIEQTQNNLFTIGATVQRDFSSFFSAGLGTGYFSLENENNTSGLDLNIFLKGYVPLTHHSSLFAKIQGDALLYDQGRTNYAASASVGVCFLLSFEGNKTVPSNKKKLSSAYLNYKGADGLFNKTRKPKRNKNNYSPAYPKKKAKKSTTKKKNLSKSFLHFTGADALFEHIPSNEKRLPRSKKYK